MPKKKDASSSNSGIFAVLMWCLRPKSLALVVLALLAVMNFLEESGYSAQLQQLSSLQGSATTPSTSSVSASTSSSLLCTHNPYANNLVDSLDIIAKRMQDWLSPAQYDAMWQQAQTNATEALFQVTAEPEVTSVLMDTEDLGLQDGVYGVEEPFWVDQAWLDTVVVIGLTCFVLCLMNLSTVCYIVSI